MVLKLNIVMIVLADRLVLMMVMITCRNLNMIVRTARLLNIKVGVFRATVMMFVGSLITHVRWIIVNLIIIMLRVVHLVLLILMVCGRLFISPYPDVSNSVSKVRRLANTFMMTRGDRKFMLLVKNIKCRTVVITFIMLMVTLIVLLIFVMVNVVTNTTCRTVRFVRVIFGMTYWKVLFTTWWVIRRRRIAWV